MSLFFQNWDTSLPYIINYSLLYIGIHEVAFEFVCETELTINYSYTLETIQEMFRVVFWVILPCDDGGSTHVWNVRRQSFYTAV
jgi:hypothetical protein